MESKNTQWLAIWQAQVTIIEARVATMTTTYPSDTRPEWAAKRIRQLMRYREAARAAVWWHSQPPQTPTTATRQHMVTQTEARKAA